MKNTSMLLQNYYTIIKSLADLKKRIAELSEVRTKEILAAITPLVEAELRKCDDAEQNLLKEEGLAWDKETDYIAKRIMGASDFEQDVHRFAMGVESDSKGWRDEFYLKYYRQREMVFCRHKAFDCFKDGFEKLMATCNKKFVAEMLDASAKDMGPLMSSMQEDLEKSQSVSLDQDSNGNLISAPIMPDNQGAFYVGECNVEIGDDGKCPLRIIIDSDRMNVITYEYPKGSADATACNNCRSLLENLLAQILMFSLPDTSIEIYDGDSLLSGFDGLLKDLKVQVGETEIPIIHHHARFDEGKILSLSSEFTVDRDVDFGSVRKRTAYVFVLVPEDIEDRDVLRFKTTIQDAVSQGKYGFHVVLVGQSNAINKFGEWDERKCLGNRLDFLPNDKLIYSNVDNRIEGSAQVTSWASEDEKRQRVRTILGGLAIPPKPISKEALALRIAHTPQSEKEFCVILDKEHSGTTFIEGEPGAGKSILLTQMLLTAVERYGYHQVQFFLMDLKGGLTFNKFDNTQQVKYVLSVKGEDDADVVRAFIELVRSENKRRMSLFKVAGVQNLDEYNAMVIEHSENEKVLPRLVVVIDECRPLFTTNATQKEGRQTLDTALKELLRTGRALGVHFIFTSQNKGDLPSDYYDLFEHYFLLRKDPYRVRHYERVREAKDDHEEFRKGTLLKPYFIGACEVDVALNKCRQTSVGADTISLDAGTYQTLKGYPGFKREMMLCQTSVREKDPDRLALALGTSLAAVDHLHIVEFSPKKDKPNLLIVGRAEIADSRGDIDAKSPPRDACINLMLQSLRLSPLDAKVAVVDPNKRLGTLPAISNACARKPRYVTEENECRAVIREWVAQGAATSKLSEETMPFVLFVIDAQTNWLFKDDLQGRKDQNTVEPSVGRRSAWLTRGITPQEPSSGETVQVASGDNWNDMLLRSLTDGQRNKAYLVLVSDSPGMIEENFSKLKHFTLLSRFRVVHFNYSGERLSQLPRSFDNRSETNGSLFESGEYENLLANRFLPFEPFPIEPQSKESK